MTQNKSIWGNIEQQESTRLGGVDDVTIRSSDFVLVKFCTKKTVKYYVGQILQVVDRLEYEVKFLRHEKESIFYWPQV